jgi:hypothetical protein
MVVVGFGRADRLSEVATIEMAEEGLQRTGGLQA